MSTDTIALRSVKDLAAAADARTSSIARNLLALADSYADIRHVRGAPEYNAHAAHARNLLIAAIAQALSSQQEALTSAALDLRAIAATAGVDYAQKAATSAERALVAPVVIQVAQPAGPRAKQRVETDVSSTDGALLDEGLAMAA
ncbi:MULTISPECIES: hypothetical protein [unclassified Variovorax]|uniref:hypothetical protein n=1 Tax=unclassified Variovorax TaxID=663243 RepID=UPI00076C443D|nr:MULTISPECIES: hypothetical protein [unclassified Variovorax]KWT98238.1 hypothetical protein APY03_0909 [Variovorax sp. WDL1]PNG50261.1 hypothetical protein CHC06_05884 [Variovorax sp. B2]PNG51134.1 hypothetical protein CHC07_05790 [Variovorax sp. B4]VTU42551.1 hypothetical protein SRS16P1_00298 [Variovorax sp. SRS16]VTU42576.1 hypothetical protein E5P1_00296 [Variovorax sp. PBL-E5]